MKSKILILTTLTLSSVISHGATIMNFSGSVDDFYGGFNISFDLDPIDLSTPQGVDSIMISFSGLSSSQALFSSSVGAWADDRLASAQFPTYSVDIIGDHSIIVNTSLINQSSFLDLTFKGGIEESLILTESYTGDFTGNTYDVDIILNPHQGSSPSLLAEQEFLGVATQDDFNFVFLGVPEPSSSILLALGFSIVSFRRKRVI